MRLDPESKSAGKHQRKRYNQPRLPFLRNVPRSTLSLVKTYAFFRYSTGVDVGNRCSIDHPGVKKARGECASTTGIQFHQKQAKRSTKIPAPPTAFMRQPLKSRPRFKIFPPPPACSGLSPAEVTINPDFPLEPYADEKVGVKCTGSEKVLDRSQRPSIHCRWRIAIASFKMSLRPSVVV